MRRLISTAFFLFRYAVLSGTLIVICGFLMACFAGGTATSGSDGQQLAAAAIVASLLLPAAFLRRRKKGRPRPRKRARSTAGVAPRRAAPGGSDGHAFEQWVADRLEAHGWRAHVTAGSGDQGIDIIARRDGRKIGIQCKRYTGAVGNKAVQEAFSGRAFHRVDMAVVITTGHYTESARALSRRTGVHLLHVKDIPRMRRLT